MPPQAIDVHSHFPPEPHLELIAHEGASFGASVDRSHPKGPVLRTAGGGTPPRDPNYFDIDLRVRAMTRAGEQMHTLSLTAPRAIVEKGLTLRAAGREKILQGNAARLLGLR